MHPAVTRRLPASAGLLITLGAGLAVRGLTHGAVAKYGGVLLYATMIYAAMVVWRPRARPARAAVLAFAVCWVVEFAQLTPVPAALSERSRLAALALGSTFNAPDLAAYAAGVLLGWLVHHLARGLTASSGLATSGSGLVDTLK